MTIHAIHTTQRKRSGLNMDATENRHLYEFLAADFGISHYRDRYLSVDLPPESVQRLAAS